MGVVAILSGRVHSTFRIHYITVPTDVVGSNLNGDMNAQLIVTAVQFILFNFASYSPSIAIELKVSKEITFK